MSSDLIGRSTSTRASPSERLGPRTGTSICDQLHPLHHSTTTPDFAHHRAPRASRRQSQTPYPNSPQHRRVRDRAPLFPGPLSRCVRLLMSTTRHLRTASQPRQQRVHATRRVADCVLGLYPVPDLSRCTESPRGHLLGQFPLLLNTQIARLTCLPSCERAPPPRLPLCTSAPTSEPFAHAPPPLSPPHRAANPTVPAIVHEAEFAECCPFVPGRLPSASPAYPLYAN